MPELNIAADDRIRGIDKQTHGAISTTILKHRRNRCGVAHRCRRIEDRERRENTCSVEEMEPMRGHGDCRIESHSALKIAHGRENLCEELTVLGIRRNLVVRGKNIASKI